MKLVDAHCHLANLAEVIPLQPILDEAQAGGISFLASSVLRKSEVDWHRQNPDIRIVYSAGIHPNFDECDLDMPIIQALAQQKTIWAVGEIGLDRGNPDLARQRKVFKEQLELASSHALPVVLHIVGHQQEAYDTLKRYPLKYLVHGYAGSVEGFTMLARLDSHFTISDRISREDKRVLLKEMLASKRYLFETDITQYYLQAGEVNPLLRLLALLNKTAEISGIPLPELIATQELNAIQLFGKQYG